MREREVERRDAQARRPIRPGVWPAVRVVVRDRLVWVLGLAALFDGISDNWIHAALLGAVAVAVAADTVRLSRGAVPPASVALFSTDSFSTDSRQQRRRTAVFVLAGAVAYAVALGAYPPYSWPATGAVVLPAAVALVVGWRGSLLPAPVPSPPPPGRLGTRAWAAVFVVGGLWELTALLMQPSLQTGSAAHPTISVLMDTVLSSHVGRSLTLLVWLCVGWFLLSHAPAADPAGAEESDEAVGA